MWYNIRTWALVGWLYFAGIIAPFIGVMGVAHTIKERWFPC